LISPSLGAEGCSPISGSSIGACLCATNIDLVYAVEIPVNFIQTAEVLQQALSCLLAYPGNPLDVVYRITGQCQEVCNLLRPHSE
jgi:hypothetical protein